MKKGTIVAIAVAIILLIAGAYVALSMTDPPENGGVNNGDGNNNLDGNNTTDGNNTDGNNTDGNTTDGNNTIPIVVPDPLNTTLNVTFPVILSPTQAKIALSLDYPGEGQEGLYSYNTSQPYRFQLVSTPLNNFTGNVLIKVYAEMADRDSGELGPWGGLIITNTTGHSVVWTLDIKTGNFTNYNVISGDIDAWKSYGVDSDVQAFDVLFNRPGNFTVTFQAFDLDNGTAISEPLSITPLKVPVTGALQIRAGGGEWRNDTNGSHFVVLMNVTNGWNVRYTVDASYLVLSNTTDEATVNTALMAFQTQELAVGQSTQFLAFFDITGDPDTFSLQYRDGRSGQIINVPLVG